MSVINRSLRHPEVCRSKAVAANEDLGSRGSGRVSVLLNTKPLEIGQTAIYHVKMREPVCHYPLFFLSSALIHKFHLLDSHSGRSKPAPHLPVRCQHSQLENLLSIDSLKILSRTRERTCHGVAHDSQFARADFLFKHCRRQRGHSGGRALRIPGSTHRRGIRPEYPGLAYFRYTQSNDLCTEIVAPVTGFGICPELGVNLPDRIRSQNSMPLP